MLMRWKLLCYSGLCRHLETVTEVLHFIETFIRPIRAFWWLRLYNVPNLRNHDDHVASNNAALFSQRRNNRHPSFAFPRTKLVLRRYEKFKPYLVYRLLPCFRSHSPWTPALGRQDSVGPPQPRRQRWLPIRWEWMSRQRKTNYCKCTHCMLCLIIMCNVAALTFYATIYEDICCICNKSREKHVLGTASTAGSLCLFDFRVFGLPGQAGLEVTIYNHHSLIKNNLTRFVLYASVVLVHQSCSSFIVLNKKCFHVMMFHLS